MESSRSPASNDKQRGGDIGEEDTLKLSIAKSPRRTGTLERGVSDLDTSISENGDSSRAVGSLQKDAPDAIADVVTAHVPAIEHAGETVQESPENDLASLHTNKV